MMQGGENLQTANKPVLVLLRQRKYATLAIIAAVAFSSALYLGTEAIAYADGHRGDLRPAVLLFVLTMAGASIALLPKRMTCVVIWSSIAVSALSVGDVLLHAPGSSFFGLRPRYLSDFNINYYAAQSLYGENTTPYKIESRYGLRNTSNSFPFPTYYLYWMCSGFGRFDKDLSALLFTLLNISSFCGLVLISWFLVRAQGLLSAEDGTLTSAAMLLVILNSGGIGAILSGQTGIIASALVILGLYLFSSKPSAPGAVTASLSLALGLMIKPNFIICLSALFLPMTRGTSLKSPVVPDAILSGNRLADRIFGVIGTTCGVLLIAAGTTAFPGGVQLTTYREFIADVAPILAQKSYAPNNISAIGLAVRTLPLDVSPTVVAVFLMAACGIAAYKLRWNWSHSIATALLISPITWTSYTALLLPVQMSVAARLVTTTESRLQAFLCMVGIGLLWVDETIAGCAGLVLYLYLSRNAGEVVGTGKTGSQ